MMPPTGACSMGLLAQGVRTFRSVKFPERAELFAHLTTHHKPAVLFIGCSDARVVPELITCSEPGELFVIRTAGNLVPPESCDVDGVGASIEYAVEVLGVAEIVVCGHSGCGAMTAVAQGADLSELPKLRQWLSLAPRLDSANAPDPVDDLIRANVVAQLCRVATIPVVDRALEKSAVTLRAWVFNIGDGSVEELAMISADRSGN